MQQNITYKREIFAGAIVEIWSHVASIGERKLVWVHEMRDAENDRTTRRANPIPSDVKARAQALLES